MSHLICADRFKNELLDLLEETFEQTQGIFLDRNTSLLETLESLSSEVVSLQISPSSATIAGHVNHITTYLRVLTRSIRRVPEAPVNWSQSWTVRAVSESMWGKLVADLRSAYRETRDTLSELTTWAGEDDIGAALAILAHTASHLGAIRQALLHIH